MLWSGRRRWDVLTAGLVLSAGTVLRAEGIAPLDLAPFGRIVALADGSPREETPVASWAALPPGTRSAGIIWDEERDIREVHAVFAGGAPPQGVKVQYWYRTWPPDAPTMPTIEDPADDHWKGSWLTGVVRQTVRDGKSVFAFAPLEPQENRKADALPGVTYRRTLKVRLVLPENAPQIEKIEAYSETTIEPLSIRIELGAGEPEPAVWSGSLEIYNGAIRSVRPWQFDGEDEFEPPGRWKQVHARGPKGVIAEILSAQPSPPGSNDITVVTIRGEARRGGKTLPRTMSFSTLDLQKGPIYVPDFHVYVTRAEDEQPFSLERVRTGQTIRERILSEPEQTYERATSEIPPLDPWKRQRGDKVYLPVAADASWQKFAVEYGGDIFIHKRGTKAKGAELKRLRWNGDVLRLRLGTGEKPYYREDQQARCSVAEEFLPIVINSWEKDGLAYEEEAFATLLEGPLDPNAPGRSEQTPAVCMVQLKVRNAGSQRQQAHVWITLEPAVGLAYEDGRVLSRMEGARDRYLRAFVKPPAGAEVTLTRDEAGEPKYVVARFEVPAGGSETLRVHMPFVSDVSGAGVGRLAALDYPRERERVAAYWRDLVNRTTRFTTPEPEFNALARSVVPHIHISTTKDPKSGLYMVPAASYNYQVFMNESCFQTQLLDALGDTQRATQYLRTCTALQGTRSFPGNYVKPHDGVFHGAKVDDEYDYTASEYGLDHGTVLWSLARHYFYTGDRAWLQETLPHLMKAIEWIERQRALMQAPDVHGGRSLVHGLLPAGHLEDNADWGYWFAVNAYCVAGMLETAAAMKDIGHPDAEKIAGQAAAYHHDLRTSVNRCTELAPVMRKRDGTYSPYVPTRAYQRFRYFGPLRVQYYSRWNKPDLPCYRLSATREVLYGPMILLNLQIFDSGEPIAQWILDDWEDNLTLSSSGGFNVHGFTDDNLWFSQGGLVFQSNLQNPIWAYLHRHETPAAIRSIYNAFVACLYPDVNAFTEEYRMWRHGSGPFYKSPDEARFVARLRDMLVMESGDELWLAGGVPRRWLSSPEGVRVDSINTVFGPVGYTLRAGEEAGTVTARITPHFRRAPRRVWLYLRLPERKTPQSVRVGGTELEFDPQQERVLLPELRAPIDVTVRY